MIFEPGYQYPHLWSYVRPFFEAFLGLAIAAAFGQKLPSGLDGRWKMLPLAAGLAIMGAVCYAFGGLFILLRSPVRFAAVLLLILVVFRTSWKTHLVLGVALAITHWGIYQISSAATAPVVHSTQFSEHYLSVPWYFLRFPYQHGLQGSAALVDELADGAAAVFGSMLLALARTGPLSQGRMARIAGAGTWAMLFCLALDPLMVVNGVWTWTFAAVMESAAVGSIAMALALALAPTGLVLLRPMDENHPSSG
jgi:hypothetical protein